MATDIINVRIDGDTKLAAEGVLGKIGLTPSDAIRMFYNQIIMRQGLPFAPRISTPSKKKQGKDVNKIQARIKASIARNKKALDILAKR